MKSELILTTQAQARAARHEEGVSFQCAQCGAVKPVQTSGGTGYGYNAQDQIVCYACCTVNDKEQLKDRSKPFFAYINGEGNAIHTWSGGHLMKIARSRSCQLTRHSFWHSRDSFMSVHCVDVHGGHWHGRGSAGICIKLRPCKAS